VLPIYHLLRMSLAPESTKDNTVTWARSYVSSETTDLFLNLSMHTEYMR
jgi:hypothetical protein